MVNKIPNQQSTKPKPKAVNQLSKGKNPQDDSRHSDIGDGRSHGNNGNTNGNSNISQTVKRNDGLSDRDRDDNRENSGKDRRPSHAHTSTSAASTTNSDSQPTKAFFYGTLVLISIVLSVYVVCRFFDTRSLRGPIWGPVSLILLGFIVYMLFVSLFKIQAVSPGVVTNETVVDTAYERKANGSLRYCRKTRLFKPDRAHYCHTTKNLIMRFDHHCVFLNASIGLRNHRYFILFMFYATIGCGLIAIDTIFGSDPFSTESKFELSGEIYLMLFVVFVLSSALSISLGGFCAYHIYLLLNGMTQIESSEQYGCFDHTTGRIRTSFKPYQQPTIRGNLEQIMGTDIKTWLLPTFDTIGLSDGVHWWSWYGKTQHHSQHPQHQPIIARNEFGSAY